MKNSKSLSIRLSRIVYTSALALALFPNISNAVPGCYTAQILGQDTIPYDINNAEDIVGTRRESYPQYVNRPFLIRNGQMNFMGLNPTTGYSIASSVSSQGVVVGQVIKPGSSSSYRGFIWQNGGLNYIQAPDNYPNASVYLTSVNSRKDVVGSVVTSWDCVKPVFVRPQVNGSFPSTTSVVPPYCQGQNYVAHTPNSINSKGNIAMHSNSMLPGNFATLFELSYLSYLPLTSSSPGYGLMRAYSINESDVIVGSTGIENAPGSTAAPARWTAGVVNTLGQLYGQPGEVGAALDINSGGTIVGYAAPQYSAPGHGFVFSNNVISDLNSRLCSPLPQYQFIERANAINDNGTIVGVIRGDVGAQIGVVLRPALSGDILIDAERFDLGTGG